MSHLKQYAFSIDSIASALYHRVNKIERTMKYPCVESSILEFKQQVPQSDQTTAGRRLNTLQSLGNIQKTGKGRGAGYSRKG